MQKDIENKQLYNYNKSIQYVNDFCVSEKDYTYGHIKEFIRLRKEIKKEAHRVISSKVLLLNSYGKIFGSEIDINGNTYDFEIFEDSDYRIVNVEKYKDINKEVMHERNINKNSRYIVDSSFYG